MKFINTAPNYLEFKVISCKNPYDEYKEFYKFLLDSCIKDKNDIEKKELKYLIDTYCDLISILENKNLSNENCIKLLKLCMDSRNKLSKYIEKGKKEYERYDEIPSKDKEYPYYSNLSSWYSLKVDLTEKIINNLYNETKQLYDRENSNIGKVNLTQINQDKTNISYVKMGV